MPDYTIKNHLKIFIQSDEPTSWIASRKPYAWAKIVGVDEQIYLSLQNKKIDRDYLKQLCADTNFSAEQCFLSIMAWGGMKVPHGKLAWQAREGWIGIVGALRDGTLTRRDAYDRFWQFRKENPRCGMGPAFYTKLIFFAHPQHDGYIMDQWTALSVNLLKDNGLGSKIVQLTPGVFKKYRFDVVNDRNTPDDYEQFCQAIESIAKETGLTPEMVEERMFSQGGRNPGQWRQYVKNNRPPLK